MYHVCVSCLCACLSLYTHTHKYIYTYIHASPCPCVYRSSICTQHTKCINVHVHFCMHTQMIHTHKDSHTTVCVRQPCFTEMCRYVHQLRVRVSTNTYPYDALFYGCEVRQSAGVDFEILRFWFLHNYVSAHVCVCMYVCLYVCMYVCMQYTRAQELTLRF
jgi:hypothetical protein